MGSVSIDTRPRESATGSHTALDSHTVVCGVPLFVRTVRALGRAGIDSVTLLAADREASTALSETLARYPAGQAIKVAIDIRDLEEAATDTALIGTAVYDRSKLSSAGTSVIEPLIDVRTASDRRRARRLLFAAIRKSIALDGVIAYYAHRPLSRLLSGLLVNTRVSANHATMLSLSMGLVAAFFAAQGDRLGFALAGAGYFASGILDCVDGDLARIRLESSKLGEWLDAMTDEANTLSLLTGIGIGLYRSGADPWWLAICLAGAGLGALSLGRMYLELHRLGGVIDTAQFPWFFRDQEDTTSTTATSPLGWVLLGVGYLIRRDINVTGISLLLAFGLAKVAGGIMAVALIGVAALTAVHFLISRPPRAD